MIPVRLFALVLLGAACHSPVAAQKKSAITPFFKDTTSGNGLGVPAGKEFDLRKPVMRDSLRVLLSQERRLWRAGGQRNYRFLSRTACFCPGPRGWLLVEVRDSSSVPLSRKGEGTGVRVRAWTTAGKLAPLTDWDTFTIDQLYDNLERALDQGGLIMIDFGPQGHFPRYLRTSMPPYPDTWGITEVRALRPL